MKVAAFSLNEPSSAFAVHLSDGASHRRPCSVTFLQYEKKAVSGYSSAPITLTGHRLWKKGGTIYYVP